MNTRTNIDMETAYTSWRITFQSSEAAARTAFRELHNANKFSAVPTQKHLRATYDLALSMLREASGDEQRDNLLQITHALVDAIHREQEHSYQAASAEPSVGNWVKADDVDRLTRSLDAALNGDGAAPQTSLCDVVGQVVQSARELGRPLLSARAQITAPLLDNEWRNRLLDGRELTERDECGFVAHPELPTTDEDTNNALFFAALGIELKSTSADTDVDWDELDAMCEASNWSAWTPIPPRGDDWKLVSTFDTEDGPAAWWMREAPVNKAALDAREIAGLKASINLLSHLADHQATIATRAIAAMKAAQDATGPYDESNGDFDARVPYAAYAAFVEKYVQLAGALRTIPAAPSADMLRIRARLQVQAEPTSHMDKIIQNCLGQGSVAKPVFPAMTDELASILGLMCFQCANYARALRAGGHTIKNRAEDEQAAVLHWMLSHYFQNGPEGWRDCAAKDLQRMKDDAATAAQAMQNGGVA